MDYRCRVCARSFPEPGFCPFDGTVLDQLGHQPTLPTPPRGTPKARVEIAEEPTLKQQQPEAPATIRSPPPEAAVPGTLPGHAGGPGPAVRAVSATRDAGDALETIRRQGPGDPLVGQTLDSRYHVLRRIGEGGMGIVYAVRHTVIERPLAIKVLKREAMRDRATIERFVREAKSASRIGHPNIVDVTDFGTTPDGLTYSVMEFVSGATLRSAIRNAAPFPPLRAVRIGLQIARALGAAHAKRIIHRDLKPDNVFLIDRDGRPDFVKIVDFGIAKIQPAEGATLEPKLTRAGAVFGTPEYMAPEQAGGKSDTDHRVDIYALGTMLYEMVCGRTPHTSDSALRTITMQLIEPIVPPSQAVPGLELPPGLEAAIMAALAKDREARTPTMGDVVAALEPIAAQLEASRVPALVPLPPGADPALFGAPPGASAAPSGPPRRNKPTTRALHEPEFVASGPAPLPLFEVAPEPEPRRRRLWIPALVAALVGAGAGGAYLATHRRATTAATSDAPASAAAGATPGPIAVVGSSAGSDERVAVSAGSGEAAPADASATALVRPNPAPVRDAGATVAVAAADAGAPGDARALGAHPARVTVEVLTSPGDAQLFANGHYRGPTSSRLEEPFGTKLRVECRAGSLRGHVDLVFDGQHASYMCRATHQKMCVPGMKNPFDHCDDAGP